MSRVGGGRLLKAMRLDPDRNSDPDAAGGGASAPHTSRLARWAWVACVALIGYGSLTPWSGWRDAGVGAFSYLLAPWPPHVTSFDLVVNVLAYVPLGCLTVLALYPRQRGARAVASATALGVALSAAVEALQTFLPSRVASNVDLLTNAMGALLGAGFTAPFARQLIDAGAVARTAERWLRREAPAALVLLALWPMAQIDPGPMLLGNGRAAIFETSAAPIGQAVPASPAFGPTDFMLTEGLVTLCGLLSAGLVLVSILRPGAPRYGLLAILLGAALASKALAYGVKFGGEYAFAWMTPGALSGLALGALCVVVAMNLRPVVLACASSICLCILIATVNWVPDNPYHSAWLEQWSPGKLRHFSAAAAWLSTAWPYAMLAWLAYDLSMGRRKARPSESNK
jgi:VanZ family protein